MIRADIEGVSGVVSYDQAEPGKPEYAYGQRMFMADLLACVEGLLAGGADDVVIYDEHYCGRNIEMDKLPSQVSAICGKPPYKADWPGGLDPSFSGAILLGFHSKFGTPGGLLHHSYELDIRDLRLNDVSVGEIGMEAAIAGDWGVPVLLVTGDSAGVAEAEALLPGVRTVTVKDSLSEIGGRCYPLACTSRNIRTAAQGIVTSPPAVVPYCTGNPVTLEVELNDGLYLDAVHRTLGADMTEARTLLFRGPTATSVWAGYWQTKLRCQRCMQERA